MYRLGDAVVCLSRLLEHALEELLHLCLQGLDALLYDSLESFVTLLDLAFTCLDLGPGFFELAADLVK